MLKASIRTKTSIYIDTRVVTLFHLRLYRKITMHSWNTLTTNYLSTPNALIGWIEKNSIITARGASTHSCFLFKHLAANL
jgi:hypothetical protein